MTAPTREQVLQLARDAGLDVRPDGEILPNYLGSVSDGYVALAALAYTAGQDAKRIELQTEMQRLTERVHTAPIRQQQAVAAERERICQQLDDWHMHDTADAIRARSKQ